MSSQRRIDSSRTPSGPAGQARSARNAIRHEYLDPVVRLKFQHRDTFASLHATFIRWLQPAGPAESLLVQEMAQASWRTRRCWAVEASILETRSSSAHAIDRLRLGLSLIHRYEDRLTRQFDRAVDSLLLLRENIELPNEPNPISEHGPGNARGLQEEL